MSAWHASGWIIKFDKKIRPVGPVVPNEFDIDFAGGIGARIFRDGSSWRYHIRDVGDCEQLFDSQEDAAQAAERCLVQILTDTISLLKRRGRRSFKPPVRMEG